MQWTFPPEGPVTIQSPAWAGSAAVPATARPKPSTARATTRRARERDGIPSSQRRAAARDFAALFGADHRDRIETHGAPGGNEAPAKRRHQADPHGGEERGGVRR